jgi:outer membrane receptor protein involved in Fe transport
MREQAGHAALLIKPSEAWSVEVSALLQHTVSPEASTVTVTPSFTPVISPLSNSQRVPQSFESRLQYYSATANGDLGWANFVSASSYSLMRSLGSFQSYFPGDQITGLANQGPRIPLDKITQEFRLVSPSSGRLQWLLGAFYTNEKGNQDQQVNALDSSNMPVANPQINPELNIFIPTHYHEYALFANATWKFTDAFDLTVGARESRNEQSFAGIPTCSPALAGLLGGCPPVGATSSRQNVFNYAVSPSYHFSQDVMAYARVASGYRPGGPNTPLPGVPTSYKADTLVNYEIGIKTDWLDRKLRFDAAAYQIDWKDIQITEAGPPPTFFSYGANGNTATVRGFEAATTFAPVSSLHLGLNLAYSHAVLSSTMPSNSNLAGQSGDRLPYVPLWSGSLTADYKHALERGWTGALGAGWRYTGQRYTTINNSANCPLQCLGTPSVPSLPSYGVLDMHAGVSNDLWNVSIVARNLTNKYAWVDLNGGGGPPFDRVPIVATVLSARLITLSVDRRF